MNRDNASVEEICYISFYFSAVLLELINSQGICGVLGC